MLYPLKFKPIFKDKIWGGRKIKTYAGNGLWRITKLRGSVAGFRL